METTVPSGTGDGVRTTGLPRVYVPDPSESHVYHHQDRQEPKTVVKLTRFQNQSYGWVIETESDVTAEAVRLATEADAELRALYVTEPEP